ncbi:MAG: response regulator [Betaproteobacteria bacterium]|nr:response regulator [Betaproteobacteria bacterium]
MERCERAEILLIEDSACDAELTMYALEKGGLVNAVLWVEDGVQALDYLFRRGAYAERDAVSPKLVLLDLWMPRVDGIEVLKEVRADVRLRDIPVIVMTSAPAETALLERHGLRVDGCVEKPVGFAAVAEAARQTGYFWPAINGSSPASRSSCTPAGATMPKCR